MHKEFINMGIYDPSAAPSLEGAESVTVTIVIEDKERGVRYEGVVAKDLERGYAEALLRSLPSELP